MNRKSFIGSIVPALAALPSFGKSPASSILSRSMRTPPFLKPGDTIGICCCSGYISMEDVQPAVNKIKEWGFSVKIGSTVGRRDFTYGGNDQERLTDLQSMLDDPMIKAILFARGGYGAVRIIDTLEFEKFLSYPKWLIGFSDITIIHTHVINNYKIATIHSKMCNSFPTDWSKAEDSQISSIDSIRKCLTGEHMSYSAPPSLHNKPGSGEGVLIGGNLSLLQNVAGTDSDIDTRHKILFLEDTGEYLYSIDRMFWNLLRTGKLDHLHGLIIGGFTHVKTDDPGEEFGHDIYDIVLEKVKNFNYPISFDFPVGHQKANFALKCGVMHTLNVNQNEVTLTENT